MRISASTLRRNLKEKTRELDASGQLILHTDHQELHLPTLAVRTQGIEWRMAAGSEATIKYGQERIELENVRLVSNDQSLDVSGSDRAERGSAVGRPRRESPKRGSAAGRDTSAPEPRIRRAADCRRARSPARRRIRRSMDRSRSANGAFKTYKYESLVADLDYAGRRIAVDATLRQSATEQITAKGSAPLSLFQPRRRRPHRSRRRRSGGSAHHVHAR